MRYILYKATSPSGRVYVGITKNFKRRMKEHTYSKYPFGQAIRKYGKHNFKYDFEYFETVEEALKREAELITEKEVKSKQYYNVCVGGTFSNVLLNDNPMRRQDVLDNHPNLWTTENNPMNSSKSKQKMIENQSCKKVSIDGTVYYGVREAARQLNTYRQFVVHRLKSSNYPSWFYV